MTEVSETASPTPTDAAALTGAAARAAAAQTRAEIEKLGTERFVFFSDAVVAIAITLLALDLPVPTSTNNRALLAELGHNQNAYLAFLISFMVIASYWFNHHWFFGFVTSVPPRVRTWNTLWLLTIVITPFATRTLTEDKAFESRFVIYASVQALSCIFFMLTVYSVTRAGVLSPAAPPGLVRTSYLRLGIVSTMFLISIPVAFFTPWAYLCWIAMPVVARILNVIRGWRQRGSAGRGVGASPELADS